MYPNAAQTYRTQSVMTASPAQMVAMLFDRCIASLNEAAHAIEQQDVARRAAANKRARDILLYMAGSLDTENGGEIAENLRRLYGFAQQRLGDVDFRNDAAAAREIAGLLDPIRQSWHALARGETAESGPAAAEPDPAAPPAAGGVNLST